MTEKQPKRMGRPPKAAEDKVGWPFVLRLTPEQHAKVTASGGAPWVRALIDRARMPKPSGE